MITNENETKGIIKILSYLNKDDLNDLVLTITNRLIKQFNSEGMILI